MWICIQHAVLPLETRTVHVQLRYLKSSNCQSISIPFVIWYSPFVLYISQKTIYSNKLQSSQSPAARSCPDV